MQAKRKILFIDRDGTLIVEPADKQIDHFNKFALQPNVIPALLKLQQQGYEFVMVTNQDGLGTASFPQKDFIGPHTLLIDILHSQGIKFSEILICPHFAKDNCECRKPKLGLLMQYIREGQIDLDQSYVIGDRETDIILAKNMGIQGILFPKKNWDEIANELTMQMRTAAVTRTTKETVIDTQINLDTTMPLTVATGIGFFDHMLEQLAKHGGFALQVKVKGDLHIDEHHTVEDTAITIGQALRQALGDKLGINRYGFVLPMDEALTEVALDLSGRHYFVFEGNFPREQVGQFPTELVSHFFRSFSESLAATLHIKVQGENTHHMIESIFKAVGRALRMAIAKQGHELPSTKGTL